MRIGVYSIEKSSSGFVDGMVKEYVKQASRYAKLEDIVVFNKEIAKAQTVDALAAKEAYTKAFEPHMKGFCVALDVQGETLESTSFAKMIASESDIRFFIGGAYGFCADFLTKHQKVISLSRLTYAHKIAKVVLFEQIYRGLCINHHHPYHK
ncbi:MAG: 23S rRNA (pseudouridine(1915)-N(3))-methyltransferase RlmH [Campylobacterales bacterium]|nr:23S rRNA (pseudouridine(1915)-N(3))-methyltransferase RlmH [Campylobacterales bacterium]